MGELKNSNQVHVEEPDPQPKWYIGTSAVEALKSQLRAGEWPREKEPAEAHRRPTRLSDFNGKLLEKNSKLRERGEASMVEEELIGLRLYSGPMYIRYNLVLRTIGALRVAATQRVDGGAGTYIPYIPVHTHTLRVAATQRVDGGAGTLRASHIHTHTQSTYIPIHTYIHT